MSLDHDRVAEAARFAEARVELRLAALRRDDVHGLLGLEVVVLGFRAADAVDDLQVLDVVDQALDVRLVRGRVHGLRELPLVAVLLEDDLALGAVDDVDLVEIVGHLELGKVALRRRGAERRVLLVLVVSQGAEADEHAPAMPIFTFRSMAFSRED